MVLFIIGLFLLNHVVVTLIRVYLRTEKIKYLSHLADFNGLRSFKMGIQRRILRPITFIYSSLLTFGEYMAFSLLAFN